MNSSRRRARNGLALGLTIVLLALVGATIASASQSPAACNENDFILQVKQVPGPTFNEGQTINYSVRTGNTDPTAAGCDIDNTTVSLTTPDGVVHPLQAGGSYPFTTAVNQVGPTIPYVVDLTDAVPGPCGNVAQCPVIVVTATAKGLLHDDPVQDDPFTVTKQLSGPVNVGSQLHFLCYEANKQQITVGPVTVEDQFSTSPYTVQAGQLHKLCNPVDKNDEDANAINDPNHLDGYDSTARTNPAQGHKIKVQNQFGTVGLQLGSVQTVMVPSAKSLTGPVGPLANTPVDHFICYSVKGASSAGPPFVKQFGVKVQDEFGTLTVNLTEPKEFCDPASINGGEPHAPHHLVHLLCYTIALPTGETFTPPANIWINDEFQARKLRLDAHVWMLCVPSSKTVVS